MILHVHYFKKNFLPWGFQSWKKKIIISSNLLQFGFTRRKYHPYLFSDNLEHEYNKVNKKDPVFADIALINLFTPNILGNSYSSSGNWIVRLCFQKGNQLKKFVTRLLGLYWERKLLQSALKAVNSLTYPVLQKNTNDLRSLE